MPAGCGGRSFGARCASEEPHRRLRGRFPQDRAFGRSERAGERRASPPPRTGGVRARGRRGGPCARAFLRARGRRALCRRARAKPPRPRAGPPRDRRRAFRPRHRSGWRGRARGCRRGRFGRSGARARAARAPASAREEPARRGVSPPCAEGIRGRRRRVGRAHVERIPKGLSVRRPKPFAAGLEALPVRFGRAPLSEGLPVAGALPARLRAPCTGRGSSTGSKTLHVQGVLQIFLASGLLQINRKPYHGMQLE